MKAKEYAELYKQLKVETGGATSAAKEICVRMLRECGELALSRKAQGSSAYAAILKEMDQRYAAFVRIVNPADPEARLRPDGFRRIVRHMDADVGFLTWGPEVKAS